ncbi:MAG: phosphoribosylformylglycinamidine cyclo-ligase, partial [Armatimonadetes bacterium]|nr:phosphoribosylformylglycinamidine cyclo-ligase [Armatimonadota bacterium]
IVCQGARPLFFLDYLGVGKIEPHVAAEVVRGVAEACQVAGCALIGGETAELPGFYQEGEYDLVGFATGVVERDEIIDGSAVTAGDVLVGLASSGLHSNGYSLARKVLLEVAELPLEKHIPELGRTLGEELLEPTRIYAQDLVSLQETGIRPHALVHVTGGGIAGNLARVIPDSLTAKVDTSPLPPQPIFGLIQELGNVPTDDMWRTFNMGMGMIAIVGADEADATVSHLTDCGHAAQVIGEVQAASDETPPVQMA